MNNEKKMRMVDIAKIAGFILAGFALIVVLYFTIMPSMPHYTRNYRLYDNVKIFGEDDNTVDVLYVGHSRVYSGISPMEIYDESGFTGFNCAQSLQMPWESYEFVKDILKKQSPEVIVYDMGHVFYEYKKADKRNDSRRNLLNLFPFYDRHTSWKDGFKIARDYLKNHKLSTDIVSATDKGYKITGNEKATMPSKRYMEGFVNMVNLCKENDIELVLFSIQTNLFWDYGMYLGSCKLAEEYGLKYIDLNQPDIKSEIGIDSKHDYRDNGDHLNYWGGVKVSRFLAKWLEENTSLTDKRGTEEGKTFDEDLLKYKDYIAKNVPNYIGE